MAFRASVLLDVRAYQSPTAGHSPDVGAQILYRIALADGAGDDQAHRFVKNSSISIPASATMALDLTNLSDVFGSGVSGVELVALGFTASGTNAGAIEMSPSSSDGFTGFVAAGSTLSIPPGGSLIWTNPADGGHTISASDRSIDLTNTSAAGPAVFDSILILKTS